MKNPRSSFGDFQISKHDWYWHARFFRPARSNALDETNAKAFAQLARDAAHAGARLLAVSSGHPTIFCSGGDLKAYREMTKVQGLRANKNIEACLNTACKQPLFILFYVAGACVGGGCEWISYGDGIWATPEACFSLKQAHMGLSFGWGGGKMLERRMGNRSQLLSWLVSGRNISSQEALGPGLVDEIVAEHGFEEHLISRFEEIQNLDSKVLLSLKNWAHLKRDERRIFNSLWLGPAHRAALKKFLVKKTDSP